MTEQAADLLQAGAAGKIGRQRMPQQVRPAHRRIHAGAPQRVIHRAIHDAGADRRAFPQPVQHEHLTRRRARPSIPQVGRQRGPHLGGQGQQRPVTGLTGTHPHGGVTPVQVLQPQPHDLAGPHPQPGHAQDDRPVPQPPRRGRIQRRDQLLQTPRLQMPDQAAPATRHHRDRVLQPVPTQPLHAHEPQERPQARRGQRHRPGPVTAGQVTDEARHVPGAYRRDIRRAAGGHRLQERSRVPPVVKARPLTHAAGAAQMHIESGEHVLNRPPIVTPCHQLLLVSRTNRIQGRLPVMCSYNASQAAGRPAPAPVPPPGLRITTDWA